jgi:hypothetical protein
MNLSTSFLFTTAPLRLLTALFFLFLFVVFLIRSSFLVSIKLRLIVLVLVFSHVLTIQVHLVENLKALDAS